MRAASSSHRAIISWSCATCGRAWQCQRVWEGCVGVYGACMSVWMGADVWLGLRLGRPDDQLPGCLAG
eukprot:361005-Chlamydomonas_euryale.AAC.7